MDQVESEEYLSFYYRSGAPEKAPDALAYIANSDFLDQMTPHETGPLIFLFTRIAEDRPNVIRGYESVLEEANAEGRRFILSLLGEAGDGKTRDFLKSVISDSVYVAEHFYIDEAIARLSNQERIEPLRQKIKMGGDLDLLWAEFSFNGSLQAVSTIIQVLDWPDIIREKLDAWLRSDHWPIFSGISRLLRRRRLERLQYIAGIECDSDGRRIETNVDLDCLSTVQGMEFRDDRFNEIRKVLPIDLSEEEVIHVAVKGTAKWSLIGYARRHPSVLQKCEEEIQRRDGSARLALLEIVAVARFYVAAAESEAELDRLTKLRAGDSPIQEYARDQLLEAARTCAQKFESATSYVSRIISRDLTNESNE